MKETSIHKNLKASGARGIHTPAPIEPTNFNVQPDRPDSFRIPKKGGDPYFGLTRGWYYAAEKDGLLRLIHLRKRGKARGVTLVPYDDVAALIAAAKLG